MQFKGGVANGTLAAIYGALNFINLMLAMNQHNNMKTVGYVMAGLGVLLAIYWLATREVMGIPILLVGIVNVGLAARAEHVALQVGDAALGVVAFVIALMMLGPAMRLPRQGM